MKLHEICSFANIMYSLLAEKVQQVFTFDDNENLKQFTCTPYQNMEAYWAKNGQQKLT